MATLQVTLNSVDITEHVEVIRDVNASADYPEVNQYRIREATIDLIDEKGIFAIRNPDSMAKVGYPVVIQIDTRTIFSGEVIEMSQGVVEALVRLICSGASWKLTRDELTDFGIRRRFRLNQESEQQAAIALGRGQHRANGVYPILPAALPASEGSTSGFGRALNDVLIPVESLRTDGLLDYHRFIVDSEGVQTEGEPIPVRDAAFPQVILKSPYRHQRALTMVREILTAFGVTNSQLQIAPANIGEHFAQRGRVNYDLIGATGDRYDVPLAWGGFVTDWLLYNNDSYFLVSVPRNDNLYESGIVKYDVNDDEYSLVYRFGRGIEAWQMANAGDTFYVMHTSTTAPVNNRHADSATIISAINITTGTVSVIANRGSTFPPQLGVPIRGGFGESLYHADTRSGFAVHNNFLYYRYQQTSRAGIARHPTPASMMSYALDGNEDGGLSFTISNGVIYGAVSWRDGTNSECKVFSVNL